MVLEKDKDGHIRATNNASKFAEGRAMANANGTTSIDSMVIGGNRINTQYNPLTGEALTNVDGVNKVSEGDVAVSNLGKAKTMAGADAERMIDIMSSPKEMLKAGAATTGDATNDSDLGIGAGIGVGIAGGTAMWALKDKMTTAKNKEQGKFVSKVTGENITQKGGKFYDALNQEIDEKDVRVKRSMVGESAIKTSSKIYSHLSSVAASDVAKTVGKKIPFGVGTMLSAESAFQRFKHGDMIGAGLDVASGVASFFPVVGTGASMAIDAVNIGRDLSHSKISGKKALGMAAVGGIATAGVYMANEMLSSGGNTPQSNLLGGNANNTSSAYGGNYNGSSSNGGNYTNNSSDSNNSKHQKSYDSNDTDSSSMRPRDLHSSTTREGNNSGYMGGMPMMPMGGMPMSGGDMSTMTTATTPHIDAIVRLNDTMNQLTQQLQQSGGGMGVGFAPMASGGDGIGGGYSSGVVKKGISDMSKTMTYQSEDIADAISGSIEEIINRGRALV